MQRERRPQEQGRQRLSQPRWQRVQAAAEAARPEVLVREPEGEEGGLPAAARQHQRGKRRNQY